jgi:hypothetical protein
MFPSSAVDQGRRADRCATTDAGRFRRLFLRWTVVGGIDTVLLLVALGLMVLRPGSR